MLVLSRKKGECVEIGENIKVCVVRITADKVRLGIDAPRKIAVHRQEVAEAIRLAESGAGDQGPGIGE